MKHLIHVLLSILATFTGLTTCAQELVAETGSYGIDKNNKIIVWHQPNLDSLMSNSAKITGVKFNTVFNIKSDVGLSYNKAVTVSNGKDYALYISKLPLVHITIDTSSINRHKKIAGYFTHFQGITYTKSVMGVRHRGNLSLTFPKKSFDIEFWTDSTSKEKKNIKFKGMRNDDDWILDGMYNEPLRLRSHIAARLWSNIHTPYYADKEPKAKSGFAVDFVEVFKNNEYYGVYQFSESVDRKQLRLKKHKGDTIRGELYKANSYKGGPDFTKAPKYNNLFPHWNGWRTEYPFIDYTSDFENLYQLQGLVLNGTDEAFAKQIESKVHIANAIDYYLLVNVLRATDNMGKNYYLGKYNTGEPYFFVAWDLDGVMGIIQDGKREEIMTSILGNGLFNRLLEVNPNGYKAKMKARWEVLRAKEFSNEALQTSAARIYAQFTEERIYEREQLVWTNKLNEVSNENHYDYLKKWIDNRLEVLDAYFNAL